MRTPVFTGSCPALVTPFDASGNINYDAFGKLIDDQIAAGVDAVCVCGTTGEGSTLSDKEHRDVLSYATERIAGRVPCIVGTGSNDIAYAVDLTKFACSIGEFGATRTENGILKPMVIHYYR